MQTEADIDMEIHNIGVEVEEALASAIADNPDLMEDEAYADIANSILSGSSYSQKAAAEFRRINGLVEF